jgi:hypothetical protein
MATRAEPHGFVEPSGCRQRKRGRTLGHRTCKEVTTMSATLIPPSSGGPGPDDDSPRPDDDSPRPDDDSPRPDDDSPRPDDDSPRPPIDYRAAEGFSGAAEESNWREWMMVGIGLVALLAIIAIAFSLASIAQTSDSVLR